MNKLTNQSNFKRVELTSSYRVFLSKSSMSHLLIKHVYTVTSEFVQYRA